MDLKKISIENFKCFGSQVDIDLGRLTLLTGANSSGKSSIIYSVLGAIQSGEFPFQFSTNGKYINMGSYKEIVHNHKRKEKIKLGFTFENNAIKEIKTVWVEDEKSNLPKLFELSVIADYFTLSIRFNNEKNNYILHYYSDSQNAPGSNLQNDLPVSIERLEFEDFSIGIKELFINFDRKINFIGPFRLSSERAYYEQSKVNLKVNYNGEGYLDQIIYWETNKDPKLKKLTENLKKLKLLYSIKARRVGGGKYEVSVKVKKSGVESSLSDVGSGVSQFLPIMVADLQLAEDSTLFIAESEAHLHPSVQSSFGDYLANQINSTAKNYIIETHSEYLLNKIRLAIVKGELKEDDVKVLFIDNEGPENVIHNISFTPKGRIVNAPKNFFKTYLMDAMQIAINAAE
jgi:predicted ATPase